MMVYLIVDPLLNNSNNPAVSSIKKTSFLFDLDYSELRLQVGSFNLPVSVDWGKVSRICVQNQCQTLFDCYGVELFV